jgi:hypothetical protein
MGQYGILIQKATDGALIEYISSHLNSAHPDIVKTNYDERREVTQIANGSNVYSIQISKNYRVYSLILTNAVDKFGRLGYIAVRLYVPNNCIVTNFIIILDQIFEQYSIKSATSTLNTLDFESIFQNINFQFENSPFLALSDKQTYYCFYENNHIEMLDKFNSNVAYLVDKIYSFDKKVNQSRIENFKFLPLNQLQGFRKVQIVNSYRILRDFKINDTHLEFDPNIERFILLCNKEDQLYYNTTENKKVKAVFGNTIIINPEIITIPSDPNGSNNTFNFLDKYGTVVILSCMACVFIGVFLFIFRNDIFIENSNEQALTIGNNLNDKITAESPPREKLFTYDILPYDEKDTFYIFNINDKKFNFIFKNGKWKFGKYFDSIDYKKLMDFNKINFNNTSFIYIDSVLNNIRPQINPESKNRSPKINSVSNSSNAGIHKSKVDKTGKSKDENKNVMNNNSNVKNQKKVILDKNDDEELYKKPGKNYN